MKRIRLKELRKSKNESQKEMANGYLFLTGLYVVGRKKLNNQVLIL
ncbi:hypothetical protein GTO87_02765 [Ligilactobacillus saerimneri]|uniref:Uncharacterized protein n=1 Tax=Ligilactobacillus saerimneri TaxID=228229 RepID=A0A7H9EIS4_9LACO|nr:hypothetical protein [Ligilactobacillus saerimneri]QLL77613.1 hypothetical protein GTO87_02765 [Ligilactobacillus saerimneri]